MIQPNGKNRTPHETHMSNNKTTKYGKEHDKTRDNERACSTSGIKTEEGDVEVRAIASEFMKRYHEAFVRLADS